MRGYTLVCDTSLSLVWTKVKLPNKAQSYLSKNTTLCPTTLQDWWGPTQRARHLAVAMDLWVTYVLGHMPPHQLDILAERNPIGGTSPLTTKWWSPSTLVFPSHGNACIGYNIYPDQQPFGKSTSRHQWRWKKKTKILEVLATAMEANYYGGNNVSCSRHRCQNGVWNLWLIGSQIFVFVWYVFSSFSFFSLGVRLCWRYQICCTCWYGL